MVKLRLRSSEHSTTRGPHVSPPSTSTWSPFMTISPSAIVSESQNLDFLADFPQAQPPPLLDADVLVKSNPHWALGLFSGSQSIRLRKPGRYLGSDHDPNCAHSEYTKTTPTVSSVKVSEWRVSGFLFRIVLLVIHDLFVGLVQWPARTSIRLAPCRLGTATDYRFTKGTSLASLAEYDSTALPRHGGHHSNFKSYTGLAR